MSSPHNGALPAPPPAGLASTLTMLEQAFPGGIPPERYRHVIRLLYDHMSDRQLARVLAHLTGRDYSIIMDLSGSALFRETEALLTACGYREWCAEED